MAIAGSSIDAFPLMVVDGKLIIYKIRRVGGGLAVDVDEAMRLLLAGEPAYLQAYGDNRAQIERRWSDYHAER